MGKQTHVLAVTRKLSVNDSQVLKPHGALTFKEVRIYLG